jgi:CTP-dependent riboflavin kinase
MMSEKVTFDLMFLAEAPRRDGTNPKSAFSRGMRNLERLGYAENRADDDGSTWHITDAGKRALDGIPSELRAVFAETEDI